MPKTEAGTNRTQTDLLLGGTNMHKTIIFLAAALTMAGCATAPERVVGLSAPTAATTMPQSTVQQSQPAARQAQPLASATQHTTRQAQPAVQQAPTRTSVPTQTAEDSSVASLKPGATYIASFPEADRRAACERLNYESGTPAFGKCLEGDFPENPYFAQAGN
jgi:hypothetical protein